MLPVSVKNDYIVFDDTELDFNLYSVDLDLLVKRMDVDCSMLFDKVGGRYYTHMDTVRLIYELSDYNITDAKSCSIAVNRLLTELDKLPVYAKSKGHYSYRCYSYTMLRRFLLSTAVEQKRGWRQQLLNVDLPDVDAKV